ncbi:hypothetical protein [Nostoc sp.]
MLSAVQLTSIVAAIDTSVTSRVDASLLRVQAVFFSVIYARNRT